MAITVFYMHRDNSRFLSIEPFFDIISNDFAAVDKARWPPFECMRRLYKQECFSSLEILITIYGNKVKLNLIKSLVL